MPPSKLAKCIVTPTRLVNLLNWKRDSVVLAVSITDSTIGLAYASTPSETLHSQTYLDEYDFYSTAASATTERSVHPLTPISYIRKDILPRPNRKRETARVAQELQQVVSDVRASAFLVTWPLSPLSGKPGKDCGTVLHVLDAMTERETPIVTKNRPCMLWDFNREARMSLLCSEHEQKTMLNPLKSWLLSEKLLRKNLNLRNGERPLANATTRDATELASTALQEFMDLNWPTQKEQETPDRTREAEERLVRNHLLNGSFLTMEDPQTAQMRLLM